MKNKIHHYDLLEEMFRGRDERLKIQAAEYERRLEGLNHENERIMEILKQSIPREIFDRTMDAMNAKIQINTDYMNSMKGKGTGMNALWVIGIAAVLMVCTVGSMILGIVSYFKK